MFHQTFFLRLLYLLFAIVLVRSVHCQDSDQDLNPKVVQGKSSGVKVVLDRDQNRRLRRKKSSSATEAVKPDSNLEVKTNTREFDLPQNFLHVVPFRLPDGTPLLRWRPIIAVGTTTEDARRSTADSLTSPDTFTGTFVLSDVNSRKDDLTSTDFNNASSTVTNSDVSPGPSNQTRGEKSIQFPKFPMNEVAELKKNFPNMSLLVIKDDPKKSAGISSSEDGDEILKIQTSESPFQTTFETSSELLFETTILPEMNLEGSDFPTVTLTRPKANENNCCACPAPPEKDDDSGITTVKVMKDRDGKELVDDQIDNEIETTTQLLKGMSDSSTTTLKSSEEDSGDDDDDDLSGLLGLATNPLVSYLIRLQRIYTLDLEVLDRLIALLKGVNSEVIPAITGALEPILPILLMESIQSIDVKDLVSHLAQTVKKSNFQITASTQLKDLSFLNIGPLNIKPSEFISEEDVFQIVHSVIADYDHTGQNFPIQKFIFGTGAMQFFRSPENSHIASWILTRKLYEYLEGSNISVEVSDGEVMLDAHLPPAEVVDHCETTIKVGPANAKIRARRTSTLHTTGVVPGTIGDPTALLVRGDVDVDVAVAASVHARFGKSIFGHCFTKIQNDFPFTLVSHGKAWVGVRIIVSDVRIERRSPEQVPGTNYKHPYQTYNRRVIDLAKLLPEAAAAEKGATDGLKPYLVFKLNIRLEFQLVSFNVDHLGIDNCDLKFLGLKVFSACGLVQKTVKDSLKKVTRDISEFHAPKIIDEIERVLRMRIGEEVSIPILLIDEKNELLASLITKADQVTKLKADLLDDISLVVDLLGALPKS